MRHLILTVVAAISVAAAVPALAHEGHTHKLMGTITAVHADTGHVELKDTKDAAQSFYVDKTTKFTKGKDALKLADLQPGTRVSVEAKTTGGKLIASAVRIGAARATPASPAAPHKH